MSEILEFLLNTFVDPSQEIVEICEPEGEICISLQQWDLSCGI